MQKILLFHYYELDDNGGVEILLKNLSEAYAQRGIETALVQLSTVAQPKKDIQKNISLWTVLAPSFPSFRRPRSLLSFLRSVAQFYQIIRFFKPTVVHVHFPGSQSLPVVGASFLPRSWRLVVTVHGSDIRVLPHNDVEVRKWQRYLLQRADLVTAVSHSLLEDAIKLYPCIKTKSKVIYNGISEQWLQTTVETIHGQQRYVLFVGRLVKTKGVDVLLTAWSDVIRQQPNIKLCIIGEGPERDYLIDLTEKMGIRSSVDFLLTIPNNAISRYYANSEMLVLPSHHEGLGIVLIEAAACGAICIGSRVSGISEVIDDGKTGFLFKVNSPQELSEVILMVLDLPGSEKDKIRQQAKQKVKSTFLQSQMIDNYIEAYEPKNSPNL